MSETVNSSDSSAPPVIAPSAPPQPEPKPAPVIETAPPAEHPEAAERPSLADTRRRAVRDIAEGARAILTELDPALASALTDAQVAIIIAVLEARL